MGYAKIELDSAGMRAMLSSGEVASVISGLGQTVAGRVDGRLSSGDVMPVRVSNERSDRARSVVIVEHPAATRAEAKYGKLARAAASAGLEVKGIGAVR